MGYSFCLSHNVSRTVYEPRNPAFSFGQDLRTYSDVLLLVPDANPNSLGWYHIYRSPLCGSWGKQWQLPDDNYGHGHCALRGMARSRATREQHDAANDTSGRSLTLLVNDFERHLGVSVCIKTRLPFAPERTKYIVIFLFNLFGFDIDFKPYFFFQTSVYCIYILQWLETPRFLGVSTHAHSSTAVNRHADGLRYSGIYRVSPCVLREKINQQSVQGRDSRGYRRGAGISASYRSADSTSKREQQ